MNDGQIKVWFNCQASLREVWLSVSMFAIALINT